MEGVFVVSVCRYFPPVNLHIKPSGMREAHGVATFGLVIDR